MLRAICSIDAIRRHGIISIDLLLLQFIGLKKICFDVLIQLSAVTNNMRCYFARKAIINV